MSPRGSVLIYVLWVMTLLSIFTYSVGSQGLFAVDLSKRLMEQLQAGFIARAAVQYAAAVVDLDATPGIDGLHEEWSNSAGRFLEAQLAGGRFTLIAQEPWEAQPRYGLMDEERRVNLNTAPAEVLKGLLEEAGRATPEEADAIAGAIVDWRDEDSDKSPHGAEDFDYQLLSYPCKDEPFENIEELLLVKDMTPELYERLEGLVTVYGSGRLNLNTASPPVLAALGLTASGLQGFLRFRAGEDNTAGTGDDRYLTSLSGLGSELRAFVSVEDLARLEHLVQEEFLSVDSTAYRMRIEAQTDDPMSRTQVVCIIDQHGAIQYWAQR